MDSGSGEEDSDDADSDALPVYVHASLPPSDAQRAAQRGRRRVEAWYQVRSIADVERSPAMIPQSLDDLGPDCMAFLLIDVDILGR